MQHKNIGTSNNTILKQFDIKHDNFKQCKINTAKSKSITLKATTFNSGASLIKKELFW